MYDGIVTYLPVYDGSCGIDFENWIQSLENKLVILLAIYSKAMLC